MDDVVQYTGSSRVLPPFKADPLHPCSAADVPLQLPSYFVLKSELNQENPFLSFFRVIPFKAQDFIDRFIQAENHKKPSRKIDIIISAFSPPRKEYERLDIKRTVLGSKIFAGTLEVTDIG